LKVLLGDAAIAGLLHSRARVPRREDTIVYVTTTRLSKRFP
jgi:hypothetical protein